LTPASPTTGGRLDPNAVCLVTIAYPPPTAQRLELDFTKTYTLAMVHDVIKLYCTDHEVDTIILYQLMTSELANLCRALLIYNLPQPIGGGTQDHPDYACSTSRGRDERNHERYDMTDHQYRQTVYCGISQEHGI